jgi:hypothetical protein
MKNASVQKEFKAPKYGHHKVSGNALIVVDGQFIYLGKYDSPESRIKYGRILQELKSNDGRFRTPPGSCTVADLCLKYWEYAVERYKRPDGSLTSSITTVKSTIRRLREEYPHTQVKDFGPNMLRAYRDTWVNGLRFIHS